MDKIFTSLLLGLLAFAIQLPAQAPTFTINPQSTSVQMGGTVTVDVEVSDFTNILSTQYAVKWDPSILQFANVTNINDADFAGISSSISTPGGNVPAGQVTVSWFNPSFTGIDLNDGTLVFTLELTAIGCGTSDIIFDDPNDAISIEVLTGGFVDVGLTPENGTATVTGMDCGGQPADVSFTISDAMVEGGENFCLEVSVDDFTDLTDAELSINYNQSALSFASISNINLAGLSQANFNTSTPGQITMDWSNAATTVADGTVIFEICFQAVLVGNTDVTFSDTPLAISVTDTDGMDVNFNGTDGTVTVMPPDTGGGTLIVDIEDASVMQGDNFCVSVTVDNFDDVVGMAFTLSYNASQLQYVEATNFNSNLFLFGAANVANPQAGFITVNYFNNNLTPTDLPDGAVLFDICFEAIAGGTSAIEMTSDITQIEFSDSNQAVIASDDNPGVIDVSGTGGNTDLIVDIENASVNEGDNFCVSVTVDNFDDVVGMAFTLNYDASQLQYVETTNFNSNLFLFGAANVANPQAGFITVNYFNNNLTPTDLPDGAVLFDICFEAIDAGTSAIEMTSDITQIEFSDSNQAVIPADDNPGSITVTGTGGNTDLIVDIENANVTEGDNFCVSVTVDNFTDVVGMAFTLNYNASQLQYVEATNFNSNLFLFGAANVANPQPGFITVNYFNNNLTPTDLPNGAVLFDICFEAIGEGNSLISMTSDITQIEFSDSNQAVIPADDDPGSINVDPGITTTDLFLTIEDTTVDPGDNFCLEITTMNYSDVVGMAFTVTYDPNQLQYIDATNFNSNVNLFGAANVANPQPGFITVNYFENNLNPINLADGSVLFELCFEALGSGTSSDLHITSDITQIEFSDSNQDVIDFSYEEGTVDITGVFSDLRLTAEDLTVPSTEPFCAEITVENFDDIVGMAFTLNYDATHLQFQQATNFNTNLPLFGSANVANPQAGFITVNYFENNLMPTTLNDGDVLFEVCFLPLGADGTCSDLTFTSDITQIEFSDSNQDVVPFFSEEGTICLDDATPGVVGLEVGDATVDQGASFCVPVTTDNFIDVAAMSFTMVYDASHIELTGISSITSSLPGFTNASFDSSTPGFITVEWDGTSGVDLPDNTTLFELCFNAIGMAGTNSDIDFNSSVVPISLEDSNQDPLTLDATEGTVTINPEFDGFLLTIADETIEPGESFCVPVTVLNFLDVVGFAFTINYDDTQLQFNQLQNLNSNVPLFTIGGNTATPQSGFITVSYFNQDVEPTDLPNGEILFEMCFTAIGNDGDESDICFSGDITPIEISDSNQEVIEFNGECGTINISAAQPPQIVDADVVNVGCAGEETGSISLTIGGGEGGPFTYNWTHNGSPISDNTANLTDLASGTYNVTVTDQSTNLEATASYTIFAPSTSITINGGVSPPSCDGGCDGMITINVSGGTPGGSGYTYAWSGGTNTPGLSGLCAGTQTVTVTDANGCQETRTFNVPNGIGTPINIDANVGAVSCNGESDGTISLIVSGANGAVFYNWSNPPGGMGSSKTNLAAGDYNVTVTDSNSCRNSATITVPEPDEITLTETVTDVLCVGESTGAITVTAEGGNGGFSYDWSGGLPSGPTVTGLDAGSYTVTASDSEGCFTTETYLVGEPPVPFTFIDAVATPIDLGNDGAITLNLEGGNPPYDVVWTPPTGPTVNSQNLINLNNPGTYSFVAEDENGCTLTGSVELLMTLRISNFIIVDACAGEDNGSVTVTVDGGVSPYNYLWSTGTSTGPSVINEGAGTVTVTVTDSNSESLTAEFEIGESPQMVIDYELVPVTGNAANTNGSISLMMSGGTQPLSYQWDNGETTAEITNLATGTYCVTITDSNFDNNCAVDTCFEVFYSDPLGPPQITTVNTSCSYTEDGAVTIEIPGGVAPFTITLSATGMADIVMGPTTDNIIVQNGLAPGNYNVAIVDNLGQTQDTNITVEAPTAMAYSYDDYQNALIGTCDGTIDLNVTGGTPGYTVTWDNGGGSGMQPSGLCGDTWYTPTITDANGCEIQETIDAIYISNFGVEVVDITDTDCPEDENGAVNISVLGGDPNYQFIWQNSQGQTISMVEDINDLPAGTYTLMVIEGSGRQVTETIEINTNSNLAASAAVMSNFNGFNVSCADSSNGILQATATGSTGYAYEWIRVSDNALVGTEATITNAAAGDYELIVIDELMCTTTAEVSVSAPPALEIQANVKDVTCADRTDGAIQAAASGGVQTLSYTYTWDNGVFGNQQFNIAEGSYGLTVTDFNNCTAESVFVVAAPDPITITFESEPATEGCNGSLLAQVNGGTEPYQYNWINIDGVSGAEALDLCPTINSNSEYLLQIIDANDCLSSIIPAEVGDNRFPCLDERVVITPDGNGTNDEFIIFCVNDYPENHLEIYNRWGVAVFVGDNYDNTWAGTDADGNPLPEGPYYYILEYVDPEGNTLQQKGSLTILRDE